MTKLRAPISVEQALTRIAGRIGFATMGEAAGVAERTARNWSDPDTPEGPTLRAAISLDLAFIAAGGEGAPLHETFGLLIDAAHAERFAQGRSLLQSALEVMKEGSEAQCALVLAAAPDATDCHRREAAREVEEAINALHKTLPLLKKGAGPDIGCGEGRPGGASQA